MTLHTYMIDVQCPAAPDIHDIYPFGCHWIAATKTAHLTATIDSNDQEASIANPDWMAAMFAVPVANVQMKVVKRD